MSIASKITLACTAAVSLLVSPWAHAGVVPVITPIPEPSTWALMGLGAVVVALVVRNKRK